jgi:hypothetical protein
VKYFKSQEGFEHIVNAKSISYRLIQRMQSEIEITGEAPSAYPLDTELAWTNLIHREANYPTSASKEQIKYGSAAASPLAEEEGLDSRQVPNRDVDSFGKKSAERNDSHSDGRRSSKNQGGFFQHALF